MTDEHALVLAYAKAMQQGADGLDQLLDLFHEDGEYVESFAGEPQTHRGRIAIAAWLASSMQHQPPGIAITIERIDIDGENVRASWTCHSPAFTTPARGTDTYHIRDGRIQRLETVINQPPVIRLGALCRPRWLVVTAAPERAERALPVRWLAFYGPGETRPGGRCRELVGVQQAAQR